MRGSIQYAADQQISTLRFTNREESRASGRAGMMKAAERVLLRTPDEKLLRFARAPLSGR
jgi:hypothetical protein